jgi:phage gp46-like protein
LQKLGANALLVNTDKGYHYYLEEIYHHLILSLFASLLLVEKLFASSFVQPPTITTTITTITTTIITIITTPTLTLPCRHQVGWGGSYEDLTAVSGLEKKRRKKMEAASGASNYEDDYMAVVHKDLILDPVQVQLIDTHTLFQRERERESPCIYVCTHSHNIHNQAF